MAHDPRKFTAFFNDIVFIITSWYICFKIQEVQGSCQGFHNTSECPSMKNSTLEIIQSNRSWVGPVITAESAGNQIRFNYSFSIDNDKCCPGLIVLTEPIAEYIIQNNCFDVSQNLLELVYSMNDFYFLSMNWNIDRKFKTCQFQKLESVYSCYGHIDLLLSKPKVASVYIFYPCDNKKGIDILADFSFSVKNLTIPCQELEHHHKCFKYYNSFHLPSLLGIKDYNSALSMLSTVSPFVPHQCHQHAEEFLCRTILPECTQEGPVPPCRSMCRDVLHSPCGQMSQIMVPALNLNNKDYEIILEIACREFPIEIPCYEMDVNCSTPPKVIHGVLTKIDGINTTLHSMATYSCDENYQLEGNSSIYCKYSGIWSDPPKCLFKPDKRQIIILSSTLAVCAVIVVVMVFMITKYRKEIIIIIFAKFGFRLSKPKEEDKRYDAFIAYSREDIAFVRNELLEPLESMNPPFKICIKDRDFDVYGWTSNNVISSIRESKRTIIVLSQNFIDDARGQFEFDTAHQQLLNDMSFKLLIITLEKPKNLRHIPDLIKSYTNTATYLFRNDKLFWKKVLYFMPERNIPFQDDETEI